MTLLDDAVRGDELGRARDTFETAQPPADRQPGDRGDHEPELRSLFVVAAATSAALAAAWMTGGLFRGGLTPRLIAIAGVAVGAVVAYLSTRFPRGAALQYAVVPAAAVAGAALVAPSATGGTANLPGLVQEALRGGGLLQPPVPFEPGWRFILVVLSAVLTSAAVSIALSTRRPRLAVAVPAPVIIGAALLQPAGTELATSAVAGALVMAAMALAYGADLPRGEGASTRFEARRLGRGVGLLALLVTALVLLSQAGFLFPTPRAEPVVPPHRPPSPPPEPDRVLFTVDSTRTGPWRVGVLDGYDGEAFLLPPLDPKRFVAVPKTGRIATPVDATAGGASETATFRIADTRGASLPTPAQPANVRAARPVQYDPRTGVLRLPTGRPPKDFTYRVAMPALPNAKALSNAPPPKESLRAEFTKAPPPPNEVVTMLSAAPTTNNFERLQYLRQQLYSTIIAAGAGRPASVTPARVGAMLHPSAEASPYEITAAEVLIARWAGVPARIGYGFYGGDGTGTSREFHPRHGAAWLEAYFEGIGWVPLVGTPPKAKSSLSDEEKRKDPAVSAAQDLALVVYVPVELQTIELFYQRVRAWASVALPLLALMGLLGTCWPLGAKAIRRWRRQRWAVEHGARSRIWIAYGEARDRANDLNIGRVGLAPLEFLGVVAPDEEHEELAWLVTRAIWGDLKRDITDEDAIAAEELARSVTRRLTNAQPVVNRLAGYLSKASLREPYDPAMPGVRAIPAGAPTATATAASTATARSSARTTAAASATRVQRGATRLRRIVRPRTAIVVAVVVLAALAPLAIPPPRPANAETPSRLPSTLPADALGYTFQREQRLERNYLAPGKLALTTGGRVFTIRKGTVVAGSFQVGVLRHDVDGRDRAVQQQIESTLQTGSFATRHFGPVRLRTLRKADQVLWIWFPPDRNVIELFVLRADVQDGDALVREVVRQQLALPLEQPR